MGAIRLGDYLTLGAYQHFWPSGGCCILELGEFLRFGAYSNKYGNKSALQHSVFTLKLESIEQRIKKCNIYFYMF